MNRDVSTGVSVNVRNWAPSIANTYGEAHRTEHLPLDPFEGQDREVDDGDDHDAGGGQTSDLVAGVEHEVQKLNARACVPKSSVPSSPS